MTEYNQDFYDDQERLSLASARIVLDQLFADFRPRSVVDVGCGLGTWLGACRSAGIDDVLGLDGDYVDRQRLHIPAERFLARDLAEPWRLDRRFDLAMSLEVAEHLPGESADNFVCRLTELADVILFSAALPYQGGTGHVNENWGEYWADKFRRRGYLLVDLFRPALWADRRVAFWYRQNCFLYVHASCIEALGFRAWRPGEMPLSSIHPEMFLWACNRQRPIGQSSFEPDKLYWHDVADAYTAGSVIAEHRPGYGPEHQVRFGGLLDRLRARLR